MLGRTRFNFYGSYGFSSFLLQSPNIRNVDDIDAIDDIDDIDDGIQSWWYSSCAKMSGRSLLPCWAMRFQCLVVSAWYQQQQVKLVVGCQAPFIVRPLFAFDASKILVCCSLLKGEWWRKHVRPFCKTFQHSIFVTFFGRCEAISKDFAKNCSSEDGKRWWNTSPRMARDQGSRKYHENSRS